MGAFPGISFLEAVAERYGNPNAKWCSGGLDRGQRVRVVLEDEQRFVDAVAMGRRKNGKHLVRIQGERRKWVLAVESHNILVRW